MERPNIIVIYTDQQRFDTLGVNGNNLIRTPNLDRLAAEGVSFSRAYTTCPICVPSRVSFMTGRYAHTNRSWSNNRQMFESETDLVSALKAGGYTTALIGKNHCFPRERMRRTFNVARTANSTRIVDPRADAQRRVNEIRRPLMQVPMAENPISREEDITAYLFRAAREYIAEPKDTPFFLWLSIPDPHPPYTVCEPYASMYDDVDVPLPAWREGEMDNKPFKQRCIVEWGRYLKEYPTDADRRRLKAIYWGMVSYIDDELGRFMQTLKEHELDGNTIVVYTTDHGDYMGDHLMVRKGPHVYEALTHIPQIVRWPGTIRPRATDAFTENIDVMPTLLDLAGVELPDGVQGKSFRALLAGEAAVHRSMVFAEHGDPGEPLAQESLSHDEAERLRNMRTHHLCPEIRSGCVKGVRTDRWKYCMTPGDVDELYDLENDPNELWNLAADSEYTGIVREHKDHILDWMIRTQDTKPDGGSGG